MDYSTRRGVRPISWREFHGLCRALAAAVAAYRPQLILPVGRGGYYPGALLAHMLRVDVYPVRLSRRENDVIRHRRPRWLVPPPPLVRQQRVLIVDEIAGSGETLSLVVDRVLTLGAAAVRSAVLYAHSWGTSVPDYIGLVSDALLLNPWDREVWQDGHFQMHPEYVAALALQDLAPDPGLLIDAPHFELAKAG